MPLSKKENTLFIIDGHSLLNRAHLAARKRGGAAGVSAKPNAHTFSGFAAALLEIINDLDPRYLVAVMGMDRQTGPADMDGAITGDKTVFNGVAGKILDVLGIHNLSLPDQNGLDIIASLTRVAGITGNRTCIITNNINLCQLAGPVVSIYDPGRKKMSGPAVVAERYGVTPDLIPDVLALSGHGTSDIDGVPGIGLKTAARLLNEAGGLEEILARPDLVPTPGLRKSLAENEDLIRLNMRLARLDLTVPLDCDLDECIMEPPHWPSVIPAFRELGLTRLLKKIPHTTVEAPYRVITERETLMRFLEDIRDEIVLYVETTEWSPGVSGILGMAIATLNGSSAFYLPLAGGSSARHDQAGLLSVIKPVLEDPSVRKTGHHLKRAGRALRAAGITLKGHFFDTMLASYLLDPFARNYNLDDVTLEHLAEKKKGWQEVFGRGEGIQEAPQENLASFMAECVWTIRRLRKTLAALLDQRNLSAWFSGTEMPLIPIMAGMENRGIGIRGRSVKEYTSELNEEIRKVERRIFFLAGETFRLDSASEVGKILFERLRLPPVKKSGRGYATDRETLEQLSSEHELPGELLEYRFLSEINARYGHGHKLAMNMDRGKARLRFDQTVSGSGRTQGLVPALEHIPENGFWGNNIREAFVARAGHVFVIVSYADLAPRLLAHFSRDAGLCLLVSSTGDVHAAMAALTLPELSESEGLQTVKALTRSLFSGEGREYGPVGRSRRVQQALQLCRKRFFSRFPGVERFKKEFTQNVISNGCFETVAGRNVHIRNLGAEGSGSDDKILAALLDTSALDLLKMSMVCISNRLESNETASGILLPVHNGLLLETPAKDAQNLAGAVREEMESVVSITVELKAVAGIGSNWEEARTSACTGS